LFGFGNSKYKRIAADNVASGYNELYMHFRDNFDRASISSELNSREILQFSCWIADITALRAKLKQSAQDAAHEGAMSQTGKLLKEFQDKIGLPDGEAVQATQQFWETMNSRSEAYLNAYMKDQTELLEHSGSSHFVPYTSLFDELCNGLATDVIGYNELRKHQPMSCLAIAELFSLNFEAMKSA